MNIHINLKHANLPYTSNKISIAISPVQCIQQDHVSVDEQKEGRQRGLVSN